jgi:hypothetical protein
MTDSVQAAFMAVQVMCAGTAFRRMSLKTLQRSESAILRARRSFDKYWNYKGICAS